MLNQKQLGKKIKELRENSELSQEELAKKIGLSRVAVSQLEGGKRGLEVSEWVKLSQVFEIPVDFLISEEQPVNPVRVKKETKTKKIKFNEKKLKNVILYVLEKCGGKPNVGETVLYKLLYFLDFDFFELNNKSITGTSYVKLQFGPVPCASEYNPVIRKMTQEDELKIITQKYHNKMQKRYIALVNADISIFEPSELEIIDETISRLSHLNATRIENYVHEDVPWRKTQDREVIDYDLVFDRTAPYAHRDYEECFAQTSAKDALNKLKSLTKEEYDYYMNL